MVAVLVMLSVAVVGTPVAAYDTDGQTVVIASDSDEDLTNLSAAAVNVQQNANGTNTVVGARDGKFYRPGVATTHKFAEVGDDTVVVVGTENNSAIARNAYRAAQEDGEYVYNIDRVRDEMTQSGVVAATAEETTPNENPETVLVLDKNNESYEALVEWYGTGLGNNNRYVMLTTDGGNASAALDAAPNLNNTENGTTFVVQNSDARSDFNNSNYTTQSLTEWTSRPLILDSPQNSSEISTDWNATVEGATLSEDDTVWVVNNHTEGLIAGLAHSNGSDYTGTHYLYFADSNDNASQIDNNATIVSLVDGFNGSDADINYSSHSGLLSQFVHHMESDAPGAMPGVVGANISDDNSTVTVDVENAGESEAFDVVVELDVQQNTTVEGAESYSFDSENGTLAVTLSNVDDGEIESFSYDAVPGDQNPRVTDYEDVDGVSGESAGVTFTSFPINVDIVPQTLYNLADFAEDLTNKLGDALGLGPLGTAIVLFSSALVVVGAVYLYFRQEDEL